jgi:hypothetical protein
MMNNAAQKTYTQIASKLLLFASKLKAHDWGAIAFLLVILLLNVTLSAPKRQTESQKNPIAYMSQSQAYDDAKLVQEKQKDLDDTERNLTAFLYEERQRHLLQVAQTYRAYAAWQGSQVSKPALQLLQSYWANRKSELSQQVELKPKSGSFPQLFAYQLASSSAIDKILALRLAIALEKPVETRTQSESDFLAQNFPILNSGGSLEQLTPRPAKAIELLESRQAKALSLQSEIPEEQAKTTLLNQKIENCSQQQTLTPGCKELMEAKK